MAQSLGDIMASLEPAYSQQRSAVQSQIDALPGQATAAQAGLDAAKNQAFQQINNQANANGMYFSGFSPDAQAKYLGATYLPAVANLQNTETTNRNTLEGQLASINADEAKQAQANETSQLNAEQSASAARAAAASNPGLDLGSLLGVAANAPQQAPTLQDNLTATIQHLFAQDPEKTFLPGYTERQIVNLQKAFPEVNPNALASQVYTYRKQKYGE